ncbi:MAG TPA: cyclase family protein [Candidatus Saccharimonadales bacterium]|nr:cyclase family protein [Candidatus Saccharimonadales bacterium]
MKIYDISLTLSPELTTSPGENFFNLESVKNFKDHQVNLSKVTLGNHNGTHIDAPLHFIEGGMGAREIDIEKLIGECQVLEIAPKTNLIEKEEIDGKISSERVLFKTTNSNKLFEPFTSDYISIGQSGAEYLVEKKVKLVGIDYFGCEAKGSPGHPVHTTLLKNKIVILEGIDLSQIEEGNYEIFVGALKIKGSDGAPARVFLSQSRHLIV